MMYLCTEARFVCYIWFRNHLLYAIVQQIVYIVYNIYIKDICYVSGRQSNQFVFFLVKAIGAKIVHKVIKAWNSVWTFTITYWTSSNEEPIKIVYALATVARQLFFLSNGYLKIVYVIKIDIGRHIIIHYAITYIGNYFCIHMYVIMHVVRKGI